MSAAAFAVLCLIGMAVMILAGFHVATALFLSGLVGLVYIVGFSAATETLAMTAFGSVLQYDFVVIPLFIFMGALLTHSGLASGLFQILSKITGRIPGGLGVSTVMSNAVFASVTGVSIASAVTFTSVAHPPMRKMGYSNKLSLGVIAGSSVLGMLLPPSLLLILYGILTGVSIGDLFIAGIIPGLVLALIFSATVIVWAIVKPQAAGRTTHTTGGTLVPARNEPTKLDYMRTGGIVALFALVIGGIWGGFFTPTEAASVGVIGALILAVFSGLRWKAGLQSVRDAARISGSVLILIVAAQFLSKMLTISGLVQQIASQLMNVVSNPIVIVLMFVLILIVLGTVLDSTSIVLIVTPLALPILQAADVNLLWFGVILVVAVEIGLVTPPFGMVVLSMASVLKKGRARVEEIFAGSIPFILGMLAIIGLMILFPSLVTWLPGLRGS